MGIHGEDFFLNLSLPVFQWRVLQEVEYLSVPVIGVI